MNTTKRRFVVSSTLFILGTIINVYFSCLSHLVLKTKSLNFNLPSYLDCIKSLLAVKQHLLLFLCFEGFIFLFAIYIFFSSSKLYNSRMIQVTPDISTPVPAGQKQHGSARWMMDKEKDKYFSKTIISLKDPLIKDLMARGFEDLEGKQWEE